MLKWYSLVDKTDQGGFCFVMRKKKQVFDIAFFLKWMSLNNERMTTQNIARFYELPIEKVGNWAKVYVVKEWENALLEKFFEPRVETKKFANWLRQNKKQLNTKTIAEYCGCSNRLIQIWAKDHNIGSELQGGRKCYIWNSDIIEDALIFGIEHKKKIGKTTYPTEYYSFYYKKKKPFDKQTISSAEVVKEVGKRIDTIKEDDYSELDKSLDKISYDEYMGQSVRMFIKRSITTRAVQKWAKQNGVPYKIVNNKKYYLWTREWIIAYRNRRRYKPRIIKAKKYNSSFVAERNYVDVRYVEQWARKNDVPYIINVSSIIEYLFDKNGKPIYHNNSDVEKIKVYLEYDLVQCNGKSKVKKHFIERDYFVYRGLQSEMVLNKKTFCWTIDNIKLFEE
jgi:hypothetical protein